MGLVISIESDSHPCSNGTLIQPSSPSPPLSPVHAQSTQQQRRGYWLRTLHQWHWISASICLVGMLLFSVTGITLNHAAKIEGKPEVVNVTDTVPATLLKALPARGEGKAPLPVGLRGWLRDKHGIVAAEREAEWSEDEVYLSMPGPGSDAWPVSYTHLDVYKRQSGTC